MLSRDILPNKRVNCELLLTYDLKLKEGATVTLRKPELDDILYDSNFDSTLLMVHDMHKRVVAFGDIYAKAVKLEKGDYTVRLQLRHDNMELLEAFKTMPMYADLKLDSSVSLDVYSSLQDLQNPAKKSTSFKNGKIGLGEPRPFFIDCKFDKKGIKSGDILVGEMTYGNGKIEGGCVPATFVVAPEPNKESADSANGDDKEKPKLDEAVRDLKLDFLKKLTTPEEQKAVVDELVRAFPAHLPTLVQVLEVKVAALKTTDERVKAKDAILAAAKAVIDSADEQDVLGFTATKAPAVEGKEYAKKKKDVGDRKKALAQAYYRQAETLMLVLRSKPDAADADVVKAFEASWAKFSTFGDVADLRGLYLLVARETFSKRYGRERGA